MNTSVQTGDVRYFDREMAGNDPEVSEKNLVRETDLVSAATSVFSSILRERFLHLNMTSVITTWIGVPQRFREMLGT